VVPLSVGVAVREWRSMDRRGLGWAITGRVPGTVLGSVAIALVSTRSLAIGLAAVVLSAVGISLVARRFVPTPRALVTAGFASGFMGTTTSIGGPPMALVYQHSDGPTMRSTLATYFSIGATLSLVGIGLAGKLGRHEVALGLALLPGVLAGFLLSRPLTAVIDRRGVRGIVLIASAASAVALLVEELW
jgi:uncharacterized membrane protein YfcA